MIKNNINFKDILESFEEQFYDMLKLPLKPTRAQLDNVSAQNRALRNQLLSNFHCANGIKICEYFKNLLIGPEYRVYHYDEFLECLEYIERLNNIDLEIFKLLTNK